MYVNENVFKELFSITISIVSVIIQAIIIHNIKQQKKDHDTIVEIKAKCDIRHGE